MRHFYRVLQAQANIPLMTEIMRHQEIFDKDGVAKTLLPDAKRMALGIMQVTNGLGLAGAELHRIDHDSKWPVPADRNGRYLAVLSGQVMCLVEDECPAFNAGEVWWLNSKFDAIVVNKSGDDAIVLYVTVKVEE